MRLSELAEKTGASIENGLPDLEISGCAGLDLAGPGQITFLANPKYTNQVSQTRAAAIFLDRAATIDRADLAIVRADDPYLAYTKALTLFFPRLPITPGIHPSAIIHDTASVSENVEIGPYVHIGRRSTVGDSVKIHPNVVIYDDVSIGDGTELHSGVAVRESCEIGRNCIIHNNTTIGSDGFGYAKTEDRKWLKIPQTGRVIVEDDVEIGANSAIDRASVGVTRIRRGAKIDNLVQIGHSCTVDEDALICAQTGLAGSSTIGKRVVLAGQVGIAGHLTVGDDAVLTAKSATSHDVEPGQVISGVPGFENRAWLRSTAAFRRLGEIPQKLRELEARLTKLEKD